MLRLSFLLLVLGLSFGQTTGKISGVVSDAETGEAIIGANVRISGTNLGAATDVDGFYYIINLDPGIYNIEVRYIGYKTAIRELRVSVNRTTEANIQLNESAIDGEEVTVSINSMNIKKDQTSAIKNVSSDQIEILPVENVADVINMQAGVVQGHFRGGRNTEVTYLIDGIKVDEGFSSEGQAVALEPDAVSEIEVIIGTFNAEYGKAMSGVVNQITKSGTNNFEGSTSFSYANYLTPNSDIFPGINQFSLNRNQDYRLQIGGPILRDKLFFFLNYKMGSYNNHLNGFNYFSPSDQSDYSSDNPNEWVSENSGDSSLVAMNTSKNSSLMGKLKFVINNKWKTSFLFTNNIGEWHPYSHAFRYNPNGVAYSSSETSFYAFQSNYMLSNSIFFDIKYSNLRYSNGYFVYEDPTDSRYVNDIFLQSRPGFFTGGQEKAHSNRETIDHNFKFDINYQLNKYHNLKSGIDLLYHNIKNNYYTIQPHPDSTDYHAFIFSDTTLTTFNDIFDVSPSEISFYIQDKMEFDAMVINLGLRFDRFDPNTLYPSEYRNPLNMINQVDSSDYNQARIQTQFSPRLGIAYQVANEAVVHFSYGHFFQMPPFYAMYNRSDWLVPTGNYETVMGNPNLSAERTVKYEIGLWQRINNNLSADINLYYKDIYDLLSTKTITTFNDVKYGLYTNKDYGNVRGLELKLDYIHQNVSILSNYTLQFTRGIADHPTQTFSREGSSQDPVNTLIPMSWDQRHTFNLSVGYNTNSYGCTVSSYFNSGTTYTFEPVGESNLASLNLLPNNSYKPSTISVDLRAFYALTIRNSIKAKISLSIYNLLDRLNEVAVHADTGRAYYSIITDIERATYQSTFSTLEDVYGNPSMFSAPRQIKLNVGITF